MATRAWRRGYAAIVTAHILLTFLAVQPPARAEEPIRASLEYSITPGIYNNTVRVANLTTALYPRLAIDRSPSSPFNGTIYVVGNADLGCAPLVVLRSFSQGQTFSRANVSAPCVQWPLNVAVDDSGTLYLTGTGPRVLRSQNGGLNWSLLTDLDTSSAWSSLTVDRLTGAVYVTWAPFNFTSGPVFVASSRDQGGNWTRPVDILSGQLVGSEPQIAAFNDSVVVGFVAHGASGGFVAAVTSSDGGNAWGSATALTQPECPEFWPGACSGFAPSAAASSTGIFAVSWYSAVKEPSPGGDSWFGNSSAAFVSISLDKGLTFSAPRRAGAPAASTITFGNAVTFDDSDRLFVTWHSLTPEWSGFVYVANSTDLGKNFEQASFTTRLQVLGGNATQQENLASSPDGKVYLIWVGTTIVSDRTDWSIHLRAVAGEARGDVMPGAQLAPGVGTEIELRDSLTDAVRAQVTWSGSTVVVGELPPSAYDVWIHIGNATTRAGTMPVKTWGRTAFTLRVEAGPTVGPPERPFPWVPVAGILAGLLAAAFSALQHMHLAREEILQRKVRLLMYEFIRDHPGASFSAVRDALGLKNGVASYHLGVLEKLGLIHSESRRRHRWYYSNGDVSLWRELPLSPLQMSLIDAVRRSPGIGIRELARTVDRQPSSVSYNVKALAREDVLRTERMGRKVLCFSTDDRTAV